MSFLSFQDFEAAADKAAFVERAITNHICSAPFRMALEASAYDAQRNTRIMNFVRQMFTANGTSINDPTSNQIPIPSNLYHRLNTQRVMYSLGNGVEFPRDGLKEKLGPGFDTVLQNAAYDSLIHGLSFLFWSVDRLYSFKLTEFVPLWDEEDSTLGAGIRYWQVALDKPTFAVLYEKDGYTKFRKDKASGFRVITEKTPYKVKTITTAAFGEEVIGGENYSTLPIVPLWGSRLHQSTLVGVKGAIDSYDMVKSGFADNVAQCAQVYWIVDNAGGMDSEDFAEFRKNLLFRHVATVDADSGVKITPYRNEPTYQGSQACLAELRAGIYEDFGGLDVTAISAQNQTATAIESAYQPLDENADDFEYQIIEAVQQLLTLQNIEGEDTVPVFKRNRISNQKEQTEMVLSASQYLDDETVLHKLPFLSPDEVDEIMTRKDAEDLTRFDVTGNAYEGGESLNGADR